MNTINDVNANQIDITIFVGGDATITTNEYVDAYITEGGTCEIYGNPENGKRKQNLWWFYPYTNVSRRYRRR